MVEIKSGHLAACHYVDKTVNVRQVQDAFDEFALGYEVGGPQPKEPLILTPADVGFGLSGAHSTLRKLRGDD